MILTVKQIKQLSKFCGYSEDKKFNGIHVFKDMIFVTNSHIMIRAKLFGTQGNESTFFIPDYFIDEILTITKAKKVESVRFAINEGFVNVSRVKSKEVLFKFPIDEPNLEIISKANHYFNQSIATGGKVNYSQIDIDYVFESTKAIKEIMADDFHAEFSIYPSCRTKDKTNPMVMIADNGGERVEIAIIPINKPVLENDVFNSSKYKPKINIKNL